MYNLYNLEANNSVNNFLTSFRNYLVSENVASITVRGYVSDSKQFVTWLIKFMDKNLVSASNKDFYPLLKKINIKILEAYKIYLLEENTPLKSINRKYSALRKLGSYSLNQKLITENIFTELKNLSVHVPFPENIYHLEQFRHHILKNKASKATVKNYLSDIRQFLVWLDLQGMKNVIARSEVTKQSRLGSPQSPTAPSR